MNIDVKGHSGCKLDIIEIDNSLYVKKSTTDTKYKERLYNQGKKQNSDLALRNSSIKTPKISELMIDDSGSHILMDYIYAKNFVDFLYNASPVDIDRFISIIIEYIYNEYESSNNVSIEKKVFVEKFDSIVENCKKNNLLNQSTRVDVLLEQCRKIFECLPDTLEMRIATCHGDLTLSNMLFASNDIYFIDYLDSFIETPLQDIVKLRQDTKYHWSLMMYSKTYDVVRLNMILDYIDKQIDNEFKNLNDYKRNYGILQLMNILRILPYVKEERVKYFVINILESLV